MNTPPEVISMGSPGEYHDPGPNFDLSGQQQAWKDESEPTAGLQPNGGYDKLEVKEEDGEEEELEEKGMEEEYERRNEEEEEFSPASSHLSEEEADGDDEDEGHHLDREISAREQVTSGGVHSPKSESEHHGSPREHIHDDVRRREEEEEDDEEEEEDVGIHEESRTTRNEDDDHEDSHREMNQGDDEEEDEEDEGEDDDDNDEEDRIKETQKLVAKIEHDIQGLRFQAKQRGHLLSDLHRYGAQHQQRRKEQERLKESPVEQTGDLRMAALPQKPTDEGKIIERPVSIKLRLRTRSTSPKAQQERYALSPVVKAKPGKVKMRVLRIGKQLGRWDAWKESLAVKADRDLAKIMMDHMDRTYFQQFLPPPKPDNKGHKRKKRESRKHERKAKKPKQVKVMEEPEEWADGFLDDDDMDDYYDPVEEKNDYDYDPSCESTKFGAYKPSNPVRNKRKSQRPRKLLGVNSSPRASRTTKPTRQPRRSPKAPKDEEQEHTELPVVQKKRGRKPKPKPEVIQTEKKKTPRIHRGGRRPSLMSTLRNLDWNALPRRYECKICCLRFDGIVAFRSHLETTHASEYLKSKEPNNHKPSGEENSNDAQEAEKHFHGSEKQYQESEKQYEDLGHLPDQHSSMQDAEQRRMAESEMYRTMAYGQEMIDARRFEMMPPFKRHLHESFSNEWGKMQGNMYSRPLASGQMIHGEQSWGHNRGYDTIPGYRKHYEDGRDWGKGGGQYPHVITSLGQSMHMGIDGGGGGHREEQHGEGYNMQGGNMLGMEHAPSEESTYVDMSMRHSEENPNQDPEDMSRERMEGEEQERNEQTQEGEPPPQTDIRSDESDKEAEEETNEQKDDEEEKGDENNTGKKGKRKKTKPYKEWEEIDRWAVTFVHCPQCDDYIRFRPGQKNFHFAVHAERRLCQECGKMFTKEAFRAHVRVHQAKRLGEVLKHICEVCGKGYRFKCSLSSHMRCHTGVRDFDCKICGKKFLSAHGLEKHELVHRKVKPHMCPDCGRGFTQYHNMLAHRRQHTGEKPYRCNICDRSFTHNVSLKNHKKKEHGVDLWAGTGGKPPSSSRQRSKSTRSAPVVVSVSPPVPQQPPAPPKPSVPNERELMHTLDPSQLYSMMPTLDYGHY